jgi:hypothetical protein
MRPQVAGKQDKLNFYLFKHARWIHRARFLFECAENQTPTGSFSCYLVTCSDKKFPYLTWVINPSTQDYSTVLQNTCGFEITETKPEKLQKLFTYLMQDRVTRYGKSDLLLPLLTSSRESKDYLWCEEYCNLCLDTTCSQDSIERSRCSKVAFSIGAWDPIETKDIYLMFRHPQESIRNCYLRIDAHENLHQILEDSKPRWPDAF